MIEDHYWPFIYKSDKFLHLQLHIITSASAMHLYTLHTYTVGHIDGILFSPQFHGIFLAVGDI